jgi:thiol-disulfide isomerase/thioredoxin
MAKYLILLLTCAGIVLFLVGTLIVARPAADILGFSPSIWFVAAALVLATVAARTAIRYRLLAVSGVGLCILAATATAFKHFQERARSEEAERILKMTLPLSLPHLAIGGPAPEIEAVDLTGRDMSLSQFRGKVVLLVFWASWCSPCMGDVPHEIALVEKFAGRPFALVGVNADQTRAKAEAAVRQHSIPWRSFWNGASGAEGPISTHWGVQAWPTIYVIDDQGVIRHNDLRGSALDLPLERLIRSAESGAR